MKHCREILQSVLKYSGQKTLLNFKKFRWSGFEILSGIIHLERNIGCLAYVTLFVLFQRHNEPAAPKQCNKTSIDQFLAFTSYSFILFGQNRVHFKIFFRNHENVVKSSHYNGV